MTAAASARDVDEEAMQLESTNPKAQMLHGIVPSDHPEPILDHERLQG